MPPPYCYEYPRPAVTVDVVAFGLGDDGGLRVLMIRRKGEPFAGSWAFPGGFLDLDEEIEDGARREFREETGLEPPGPLAMIGVYGALGRDPRGRTISLAHVACFRGPLPEPAGADDAAEAAWLPAREVEELAFDHDEILLDACIWLGAMLDLPQVGPAMLPDPFTPADALRLHRALGLPDAEAEDWVERLVESGTIDRAPGGGLAYRVAEGEAG